MLAAGVLVAVVGADSTNARSHSLPLRVSAPVFNVPLVLPPAIAGTKYTYRFCEPVTANACGGPLAQNQLNPSGGNGGPYMFKIKLGSGITPKGLVLSSRTGILTGTPVNSAVKKGQPTPYNFTVCVSDRSGTTCRPTRLIVSPAVGANNAFIGTWKGTYTRTTNALSGCLSIVIPNRPVTVTIEQIDRGYWVEVDYFEVGITVECDNNGRNGSFSARMSPATAGTITGSHGDQDFAFTLSGRDTIIGTSMGWFGRMEFTLNRG